MRYYLSTFLKGLGCTAAITAIIFLLNYWTTPETIPVWLMIVIFIVLLVMLGYRGRYEKSYRKKHGYGKLAFIEPNELSGRNGGTILALFIILQLFLAIVLVYSLKIVVL
jgi:hypothetical protein